MIEKQILDEYRTAKRSGILELENWFYLPVRITGTGHNERKIDGEKKIITRDRGDFFRPEFIEHCKSLPVLDDHPKTEGGMLTPDNLKENPIVGNVIDAWVEGNDIVGVARIVDKKCLEKIKKGKIQSTSPAIYINVQETTGNVDLKEVPIQLNHLALCDVGHWDVNGDCTAGLDASVIETGITEISESEKSADSLTIDSPNIDRITENEIIKKEDSMPTDANIPVAENAEVAKEEVHAAKDEATEKTTDEVVAPEVAPVVEEEISEIPDDEVEEITDDAITMDDCGPSIDDEIEHVIVPDSEVEAISDEEAETEVVDSEHETEEDKKREKAVDSMRTAVDSANTSLDVKMPIIKGRQTFRSAAYKFMKANRKFVPAKYHYLAVDSLTNELAQEVLDSTFEAIKQASDNIKPAKQKGWEDTGLGYKILRGF